MSQIRRIDLGCLKSEAGSLTAGEQILLSGTMYTARDAAHAKLFALLDAGLPLPFSLDGAAIYFAGPTPTPPGRVIGSCGPTTSSRMDRFTPRLMRLGLTATIGKGERSAEVCQAIEETGGVYLCAVGGAGAVIAGSITGCEEIAFSELGCESVKRLTCRDFPVIVGIDCRGGNVFAARR